jgi:hypothetical protein
MLIAVQVARRTANRTDMTGRNKTGTEKRWK